MRKAINIFTLVFFIWLVLDALNVPNEFFNFLLGFLLTGAVPGTVTVKSGGTISPGAGNAIGTFTVGCALFHVE